jgi:hypothetical protein
MASFNPAALVDTPTLIFKSEDHTAMQTTHRSHQPSLTFTLGERVAMPRRSASLSRLTFLPGNRRLDISIASPTTEELAEFNHGRLSIALVCRGAAVVLLHRLGDLPWQTAVLDSKLLGKDKLRAFRSLARDRDEPFYFLVALSDQDTDTLLASRHAALSPLFASMIGKAMKAAEISSKDSESQIVDLDWLMTQNPPDLLSLASIYEQAVSVNIDPPCQMGS